jgi:uncharacterized membrane protein
MIKFKIHLFIKSLINCVIFNFLSFKKSDFVYSIYDSFIFKTRELR